MESSAVKRPFSLTRNIPCPNIYVQMLSDYKGWVFVDEEAAAQKGKWDNTFENSHWPIDLEIGCGNGYFFEHLAQTVKDRNHLGIEIKYKPLIQTARRVRKLEAQNMKTIRYHAKYAQDLFTSGEIENIYIHFPDPWPRQRQAKHRLLQPEFFKILHEIQKAGSWIDFKTDSKQYYEYVKEFWKDIPYKVIRQSENLHQSEWKNENFETAFEKIFLRQKLPIYYCRFLRI